LIFVYIIHGVITSFILYKIPESPHFLYSKSKFDELHACFDNYSDLNHAQKLTIKFDREITHAEPNKKEGSMKEFIAEKTRVVNLIIMVLNWSVCSFSYYVIGFFVKNFKGNMYTNAITMGGADLVAVTSLRLLQSHVSTKLGFILSFL